MIKQQNKYFPASADYLNLFLRNERDSDNKK